MDEKQPFEDKHLLFKLPIFQKNRHVNFSSVYVWKVIFVRFTPCPGFQSPTRMTVLFLRLGNANLHLCE